jgi:hypothetical protein
VGFRELRLRGLGLEFSRGVLLAIASAIAVAGAFAFLPTPDFSTMREPNAHETFYQYIAFELDAPELCEKLSPAAMIPGGIFIAPSYARSDCYDKIARRYDRPWLCLSARRLGSLAIFSQHTSRLSCFVDVVRHAPDAGVSTYMPNLGDLVSIFAEMGYRPEELYREGITPPLLNLPDAYRRLEKYPDLVDRIGRVTDRSAPPAPLTLAERTRLFELAAHASNDVSWCERIPADLLDPGTERKTKGPSLFQRDRCILEIASNSRRPDLCKSIPDRPDDWPGPMSRRELCKRQALRPPDKYIYGPPAPDSDEDARTMISTLGYPLPDVHDVPPNEIASGYFYFIWQMSRADKVAPDPATADAARGKFLARVAALPSYH